MELKEAILATLAELQKPLASQSESLFPPEDERLEGGISELLPSIQQEEEEMLEIVYTPKEELADEGEEIAHEEAVDTRTPPLPFLSQETLALSDEIRKISHEERVFLETLRERILVLFEGMQSPKNRNIEAKVELTLNFFEYMLSVIDERLSDHRAL